MADMYDSVHKMELYEMGWVMNMAFANPKPLKKLLPAKEVEVPQRGPLKPVSFRK